MVRRIPELNPRAAPGQGTLFDDHCFHAFFTTIGAKALDTVAADKTHRQHAVIEQINADWKDSAVAHMSSGHFGANRAWLVAAVMAWNLAHATEILASGTLTKAKNATVRQKFIDVPDHMATSAKKTRFPMPVNWPWQPAWERLYTAFHAPLQVA